MKTWSFATLSAVVVIAVLVAVVLDVTRRASAMRPSTSNPSAMMAGAPAKALIRLESADGPGRFFARVLESVDETTCRETHDHLELRVTPKTAVVMGSESDVQPGAVVQVAGTIDRERTLHAQRIVILTGYLRVIAG